MAKVVGKAPLCSTDLKYYKSIQVIHGKTLMDRYRSLDNIVKNYILPEYQDFLAYPVRDANTITFHGKSYNEYPYPLSELQGDKLEKYSILKDRNLAHYHAQITVLKDAGKTLEAEYLAAAIKYIDDRMVYCYDGRVVLGVWGMQLRENVREDIGAIRKNVADRRPYKAREEQQTLDLEAQPDDRIAEDGAPDPPFEEAPAPVNVTFDAGEGGNLIGNAFVTKTVGEPLIAEDIPRVEPKTGYEFIGWDENPDGFRVVTDKRFVAKYKSLPPVVQVPTMPWYKRFWAFLVGRGCLKWLLWILLFLLLLLLLLKLLHGCQGGPAGGAALGGNDSTWVREDPNVGDRRGIYDPFNPYEPVPTPPGFEEVLPPQQGVLPPLDENPTIIPGNPSIIGNRLNILMENEDKSILDLAEAFKAKYPDEKYKVVYYDDVVKRMQIEVPQEEREKLKSEIPPAFAPEYELFVFDEALFEGVYTPNAAAISEGENNWYLNAIKAQQAWDITRGSSKVTIAIVDNGFNLNHPELASKVVAPYNVWTHSKEIFPQQVDHGTHVAGIALAIDNNGIGMSGIAPGCNFMPVQVADQKGMMTITSVLDGILYALYQGADVINVSLGSQFSSLSQIPENRQKELIRDHFKEEERLWRRVMRIAANHNATIVVAAGNDNVLAGIDAMQRPDLFITVSAVGEDNRSLDKAKFSNYGTYSTISAPGVGIYSSIGEDGYRKMDGTSMAAPIVSGAVALMKSINDTITTKRIICILKSTGVETQGNIGKLIQLHGALQKVKSGEKVDCTRTPSTGDVQVLLDWQNYNDLDLICTDPFGESVFFRNRTVPSGGQLEIDMNVEYPDSQTPIENVFWKPGGAPNGTYNVYLLYYKRHEPGIDETPYHIKVKYGGKVEDYSGQISEADKKLHICTFTLGALRDSIPNTSPTNPRRSQLEQRRQRLQQEIERINNELSRIGNG